MMIFFSERPHELHTSTSRSRALCTPFSMLGYRDTASERNTTVVRVKRHDGSMPASICTMDAPVTYTKTSLRREIIVGIKMVQVDSCHS